MLFLLAIPALGGPMHAQSGVARRLDPRFGLPRKLDLVEATVPELQMALGSRLLTSEELVRAYLDRIAAYNEGPPPGLNSFLHLNALALDEARARDAERALGQAHGWLFGLPVLLKDNIDTEDMPTTAGSVALEGSIPPDDAFLAAKLRDAGAILLGKAAMTEWANFMSNTMPSGYSSLGGFCFNPYDPREQPRSDGRPVLTPGGSSSGSGIAVAANLVAVAVGSETSGSILSPGSSNGVVGIKPTLGLVSRDGIVPITADQDTAGPLARTVTDAAILLGVLAGYDPDDPATAACLVPGNCHEDYTAFLDEHALEGARIAVPHVGYWGFFSFFPGAGQLMNDAIAVLRQQGATVEDPREIPNQAALSARGICVTYPPPSGCSTVLLYGFKHDLNLYLTSRGPLAPVHDLGDVIAFNKATAGALVYGQSVLLAANKMNLGPASADTARYLSDRALDLSLFKGALDELFAGDDETPGTDDDFDAILFPSNFGADAPARAGYPSIVVPGGFLPATGEGIEPYPFGVAFTGPAFSEPRLIGLAYDFEQATEHRRPPDSAPPLPGDRFRRL